MARGSAPRHGARIATLCAAATLAGCVSVGGGPAVHTALTDSRLRRAGGALYVGTFAELVEDRAALQLLYAHEFGPLNADLGTWGARLTGIGKPGWYALGTYGQRAGGDSAPASLLVLGAGVTLSSTGAALRGRWWSGVSLGAVYHRQRQENIDMDRHGHFLGLAIEVNSGFSILGPMKR